jgi:hypothetical protein
MMLIFTHSMICFMIFEIKICHKMPKNLTRRCTKHRSAALWWFSQMHQFWHKKSWETNKSSCCCGHETENKVPKSHATEDPRFGGREKQTTAACMLLRPATCSVWGWPVRLLLVSQMPATMWSAGASCHTSHGGGVLLIDFCILPHRVMLGAAAAADWSVRLRFLDLKYHGVWDEWTGVRGGWISSPVQSIWGVCLGTVYVEFRVYIYIYCYLLYESGVYYLDSMVQSTDPASVRLTCLRAARSRTPTWWNH